MAYDSGVCVPWITPADVDCGDDVVIDAGVLASSVTAAVELLFALSGSQYPGVCTATFRPSSCGCHYRGDGYPGRWSDTHSAVDLGYDPIIDVTQVMLSGSILDPSAYRIDEDRWLVRQDGGVWPCTQLRNQPTTALNTWSVSITYGSDPPEMGIIAAKVFACQLARAQTPGAKCALPRRVQSMSRQGVSMSFIDMFDFLEKKRTGVYEVDQFLNTYNPETLDGNVVMGFPQDVATVVRHTS